MIRKITKNELRGHANSCIPRFSAVYLSQGISSVNKKDSES